MKNRGLVVGLLLLVLLAVGGAFWLLVTEDPSTPAPDPDPIADPDGARADSEPERASGSSAAQGPGETARRRKRPRVKPWTHRGDGSLVGVLREYGTDQPIVGAKVSLRAAAGGPEPLEVVSGEGGAFSFDTVAAYDAWTLHAHAPEPLADSELPGVAVGADAQADVGVVYLTPGFLLHGSVVDSRGKALPGASVQAVRSRAAGAGFDILKIIGDIPARPAAVDRATTDAKGAFTLGKVPPGKYDFFVIAPGHQQRVRRGIVVTPDLDEKRLRFVLSEGYTLSGRVVRESGAGPEGLTVVAFPNPEGPAGFAVLDEKLYAECDAEGRFTLSGLRPAKWIVTVTPPNAPTTMIDDVVVPGADDVEIVVTGDAWLEGKVTDADRGGIENAEVMLIMEGSGDAPLFGTTLTDAQGRYRIDGLPIVRVQGLIVRASGYASYPEDPRSMMGGRGSALTVTEGRNEKNVELTPGGTVKGTILDDATDEPVAGARVSLLSQMSMFGGTKAATTGADGSFELTGVSKGSGILSVWKEGWNQDLDPMQAMGGMMGRMGGGGTDTGEGASIVLSEPGQVIERTLRIARGMDLTGRVLDPAGEPVAGARVRITSGDRSNPQLAMMMGLFGAAEPRLTDASGRFVLPGARPGTPQFVEAEAPGYVVTRSEQVVVRPGEQAPAVEIRLAVGGSVVGVVKDASGGPVAGVEVSFRKQRTRQPGGFDVALDRGEPVYTDSAGAFRIPNLDPGAYDLDFEHARFADAEREGIVATEGKETTVDVELDRGLTLAGVVLGPDDAPVASAQVQLTAPKRGVWERVQSGTDGRFEFAGLQSGQVELRASADGLVSGDPPTVAAGQTDVTLRLEQSFVISGVVRYASGSPVVNAQVSARSEERGRGGARTGEDGSFRIDGLRAGVYTVELEQGWGPANERANVVKTTIEGVEAGSTGLRIDAREGLEVRGSVVMADGSEPPHGWLTAMPVTAEGERDESRRNVNGMVTGGALHVNGLEAGRYRMHVTVGAQRAEVLVTAGDTGVRVELGATGTIAGTVTRADGQSTRNVRVQVFGPAGSTWAVVGGKGRYQTAPMSVGSYTVRVQYEDGAAKWTAEQEAVDVVEGGTTTVDLTLLQTAD